ncbi:hypothetical protein T07_8602 [Trichinella nelsoni]|uniref:Uncharacterized protein n=1 Tax=Trichinella nelsoni TaxID=6336 RepID=A0A0V0RLN6_9BILA|nr:hypothetical protein T07_8602 [Trichinella nelsoni]
MAYSLVTHRDCDLSFHGFPLDFLTLFPVIYRFLRMSGQISVSSMVPGYVCGVESLQYDGSVCLAFIICEIAHVGPPHQYPYLSV